MSNKPVRCQHDMVAEWCQDCREHDAADMACGVGAES